ncbi:uncharacterized protein [Garra rufa]|uniref:uncharacterized protein n=1 Tax=Garra rufa TaxID=137080 RepID=UPI003CCE6863
MQCIAMKAILILAFMVVFYKGTLCQSIPSGFTLLNQPYRFPHNGIGCHHAEWKKKLSTDATITIATYKNHMCTPEKGFEEEFRCEDNHLLLKSANYNDRGRYEFICDGVKNLIHLDVLYAVNVRVKEMDNITLNCNADNAKDVTWLHNNEMVLHSKMNGSMNLREGYEGRASLKKDCFKTGDLSLTITGVRKADAGIYRCFVDDETVKGDPHASVLDVNGTFCQSIPSGFTLLNQSYTFPGNASACPHAEWKKKLSTDATIATYKNRTCLPEKGFEEEFRCKDNHLLLKSANYSDQGCYEFICDGVKTQNKLDVLYAVNVRVEETDNITLNCYADSAKDVTWLHNNEMVLHSKMDGSMNLSEGYEGRASLKKDCFKTGDLSLTITGVRKADAGTYRCFVDDETVKGDPHASVLDVNEKGSGPGDQADWNCILYKNLTIGLGTTFPLYIFVTAFVIYRITMKLRKCLSTSDTANQNSEDDATENDSMLMSHVSTTSPTNESQSVVTHPVQESNFMENKNSNTRAFF